MSRATRNGQIFQPGSWDRKILPEKSVTGSQKTEKKSTTLRASLSWILWGLGRVCLGFWLLLLHRQQMLRRSKELSEGTGVVYNTDDDLQNG